MKRTIQVLGVALAIAMSSNASSSDNSHHAPPPASIAQDELDPTDHLFRISFESGPYQGKKYEFTIPYLDLSKQYAVEQLGNAHTINATHGDLAISFNMRVANGQALPFNSELGTTYFSIVITDASGQMLSDYRMVDGQMQVSQYKAYPLTSFTGYASYIAAFDLEFQDYQDMELHSARITGEFHVNYTP